MIDVLIAGAISGIAGVVTGQALLLSSGRRRLAWRTAALEQEFKTLVCRADDLQRGHAALAEQLQLVEETLPSLIGRAEVERAFAQVAQAEAQRQLALQQQQQQARRSAVFNASPAPAPEEFNTAINSQMEALAERLNRINQGLGLAP